MKKNSPHIWATGGGKGGTGKSCICANLAIALTLEGHKVTVVDLDLGGANLHTFLGIKSPQYSLSQFINKEVSSLKEVLCSTSVEGLQLISGAMDQVNIANFKYVQKVRLIRELKKLDSDFVLLDLGAGTSFNTLDFFGLASTKIIITTPEATAIENAFRFIKSGFYRMMRQNSPNSRIREIMDKILDPNNPLNIRTPKDLAHYIHQLDPVYYDFLETQFRSFLPRLVVNQVESATDQKISTAMDQASQKYFGIPLDCIGMIPQESSVRQSLMSRQPLLTHFEASMVSQHIHKIAELLLSRVEYSVPEKRQKVES